MERIVSSQLINLQLCVVHSLTSCLAKHTPEVDWHPGLGTTIVTNTHDRVV